MLAQEQKVKSSHKKVVLLLNDKLISVPKYPPVCFTKESTNRRRTAAQEHKVKSSHKKVVVLLLNDKLISVPRYQPVCFTKERTNRRRTAEGSGEGYQLS